MAASITGTVTNKTNGKPSAGDAVDLIDVQAGMADVAHATTDANGHYTLNSAGMGSYLIRVNHQGGTYFIAAPQSGASGDVSVYDVSAKVEGVSIDADMLLIEAAGGMLRVHERYLIRNTSLPPRAQFSNNTFEVVLPSGAELDTASATRPGGHGYEHPPCALSAEGPLHFQRARSSQTKAKRKHCSRSCTTSPITASSLSRRNSSCLPTILSSISPRASTFKAASGSQFETRQEDPRVDTWVAKNIRPGQSIAFTISGEGQMPSQTAVAAINRQWVEPQKPATVPVAE